MDSTRIMHSWQLVLFTDSRSLPPGGGDVAVGYRARGRLEEGAEAGAGAGAGGGDGAAVVDVGAE